MRRYNIWRPLMIIGVALLVRGLVSNVSVLFGMKPESASSLGMAAAVLAALFVYTRFTKQNRK
jgi:peptidoglycan biosynthesis protein MviN/MurJ (putative lipid II flippase)